ncbi:hypothetical protein CITRIK5_20137 [Citricoccus sp. K5]|nr:hypothetical protein CITRIK5_20137 [Citricoccus sp. K5]
MWSARLKLGGVEGSVEDEADRELRTRLLRKAAGTGGDDRMRAGVSTRARTEVSTE